MTPAGMDEEIVQHMAEPGQSWLDRVARLTGHPGDRCRRQVYRRTGSLQQVVARLVQALAEETAAI